MSQENVEAIRALYERWSRNDLSAFLEVLRPDAEFVNAPDAIDPGTRTGYGGFTAAWRAIDDASGSSSHDLVELRRADPHVIASVIFKAEGTGSGAGVEQAEFHIWTFKDGKVSRLACFRSSEDALRAAGLLE